MKLKSVKTVFMLLVMASMVLTASCAKKTLHSDALNGGSQNGMTEEAKAAKEAALKAEALERQRRDSIEEQRLNDEALKKSDTVEKRAARARFENQDILFDYDSSELTPISRMELKQKAEWLSQTPHARITIEGHCDERGTTEYNLALGEKRALAAKNYLQDLGIAEQRMNTISYGEEKPLVQGMDEASWAQNRRAHFVIR